MALLTVPRTLARHPFLATVLTKGLDDEDIGWEAAKLAVAELEKSSTSSGTSILSLLEKLQKQADYFQRCAEQNLTIDTNEVQEALVKDLSFAAQIGGSVKDTQHRL